MNSNSFKFLLFLIPGIILASKSYHFMSQPIIWAVCVAVFTIFSFLVRKDGLLSSLSILTAITCLGAMLFTMEKRREVYLSENRYVSSEAIVFTQPKETKKSYSCDLLITNTKEHYKVKAYFEKSKRASMLQTGDNLECYSCLQAPRDYYISPHFNYKDYLIQHGFHATTYIPDDCWQTFTPKESRLTFFEKIRLSALKLRNNLLNRLKDKNITDENYGLLAAISLGDKSSLSKEMRQDYINAGVAHILALSGLHLTIIINIISLLLYFMNRRLRIFIEFLFVWSFVLISGMPVSIIRVALMFSIMILANAYGSRTHSINTLGLAALIILILSPKTLFDISFQLSFSAVFFIMILHKRLMALIPERILMKSPIFNKFVSIIFITFSAQLGTLPLTLYYFGQFPTYFLMTNCFISIFAVIVLTLIMIALVLNTFPPVITMLNFSLQSMSDVISWISNLPYSTITDIYINIPQTIILYVIIAFLLYPLFHQKDPDAITF